MKKAELEKALIEMEKMFINPNYNRLPKSIKGKGEVPFFKFIS